MSLKCLLAGTAVAVALVISGAPEAQPAAPPTTNMPATSATLSSQEFASKAAITGIYEIRAGHIAEQRSRNPDVDRFAAEMIRDHSKNNAQLMATVKRIGGIRLPSKVDHEHAGLLAQLRSVSSRQFDSTYAEQQVQGHQDAIALFTSYARHGEIPQLKRYARMTLPVLQHHLEMAQALPTGSRMARSR